ncbi:MAG TPA: Asp-tRNA(Asn)/Glu-tRNA(Gln) amidotransferase subunit GatA [Candidatus Nanoarchaeia archaeon]|nr:Asp-tRNA(Asn)/Glu-tRNA(Gln) amidotransferase subunit GatA [Candidatus Nanoarchaeia archaeon]
MEIIEKINKLKEGTLTPVENIRQFIDKIKKEDKKINSFLHINENVLKEAEQIQKNNFKGPLYGLAIAVKSNINVKGLKTNCASKTLNGYISTYDADVIKKIRQAGGIIIGMTNCDEFASGSSGENSAFGPTQNPAAYGKIPGGSSSGSAAAVAAGFCDLSIGSDTGGSVRNPASHCGIIGVKPSYGLVSRYGLIDLSMSLDQIGPFSKEVYGSALLLDVIKGKSDYDATTIESKDSHSKKINDAKKLTIGVSSDLIKLCKDKDIIKIFENKIKILKKMGFKIKEVKLEHTNLAVQAYYILVYVEFFSGTRKFDGRKYGLKIEESCGEEVLRRIVGGKVITKAEYKGAYYKKALATKELIRKDFMKAFNEVDVILCPTVPKLPHKIGEKIGIEEMYAYDALTIPANLAGICAGSIKAGEIDKIPIGIQVLAAPFDEIKMFKIMKVLEDENRA